MELSDASEFIARDKSGAGIVDSKAEQAAFRLLSQHTFDAESLNIQVNTIHLKVFGYQLNIRNMIKSVFKSRLITIL